MRYRYLKFEHTAKPTCISFGAVSQKGLTGKFVGGILNGKVVIGQSARNWGYLHVASVEISLSAKIRDRGYPLSRECDSHSRPPLSHEITAAFFAGRFLRRK